MHKVFGQTQYISMKYLISAFLVILFLFITPLSVSAQSAAQDEVLKASASAQNKQLKQIIQNINEITNPQQDKQKNAVLTELQKKRNVQNLTILNFAPYAIQYAIKAGVPTNTIVLILLLPLLATIVVAFRYLVGLSGIGLLVPIALSITFLATDVTPGFIMLATIIVASLVSRFFLKRFP